MFQDQIELGVLLNHRDDVAADLLGQHDHLDVFVVLEAVADNRGLVVGDSQHRQQFGFRAGFQAELIRPAVLEDLFHYLALLVDLNRVDATVVVLVVVLGDGVLERLVHLTQAVLQNFPETDQDRQRDAPELKIVDQFLQVDGAAGILLRVDQQVAVFADREVPLAPAGYVVEFCRLRGGPSIGGLANGVVRDSGGGGHETSVSTDLASGASEKWRRPIMGAP
jgi:hypothetical protein